MKVDMLYDLKGDDISLVFRDGSSNDSTCEDASIVNGSLYLQDLGYFKLSRFDNIAQKGGYFISRYKYPTNVYLSKEAKTKESIKELSKGMKDNEIISKKVFLGKKERLEVKMIIQKLPSKVAVERRRKLKEDTRRKRQNLTKERLDACDLTILITNIEDAKLLTSEQIIKVYTIRWQIEIMFKCWKSIMKFGQVHKMKIERFLSMLYGHMILVVITMKITQYFKMISWNSYEVELSELKLFKAMKIFEKKLFTVIRENRIKGLRKMLEYIFVGVFLFAEKERKKNKPNQLFEV
ncbi:MAG: IS4 family transposase [Chitinophagales bacterium]